MRSIQMLHGEADKERAKANDLRRFAQKRRLVADDYPDNPSTAQRILSEAQQYNDRASILDQQVARLESEATGLEAKLNDLERRKVEVQAHMQAELDRLDAEEKMLRGDIHPFL